MGRGRCTLGEAKEGSAPGSTRGAPGSGVFEDRGAAVRQAVDVCLLSLAL